MNIQIQNKINHPASKKVTVFSTLRDACSEDWAAYINHKFVQQLGDGSLPKKCFQHYLIQLYLFSKHYSRAYALAVFKSEHLDDLREAASHVDLQLNYEMALHVDYCAQWGIDMDQLDSWQESDANRLYTRYVLDQGMTGDLLDLLIALTPCSLGYAEIGSELLSDPATKITGNPYRAWIELHGGHEFQEGAQTMSQFVDRVAERRGISINDSTNKRWRSLKENFRTATQMESRFWEMGLHPPTL